MSGLRVSASWHKLAGFSYVYYRPVYKNRRRLLLYRVSGICLAVFLSAFAVNLTLNRISPITSHAASAASEPDPEPAATVTAPAVNEPLVEKPEQPTPMILQNLVETWAKSKMGSYGIMITDAKSGVELASYRADEQYFTASIYKIYVAYGALLKVDTGEWSLSDISWGDWTLEKCINEMITNSHNGCAEAVLDKYGRAKLQKKLDEFGLKQTKVAAFMISSHDTAALLARLNNRQDLSDISTDILMNAMLHQKYDQALKKGMSGSQIADKVGFLESTYHDAGIVTLPNGRVLIVSVLSNNSSARLIADLGSTIEQAPELKQLVN